MNFLILHPDIADGLDPHDMRGFLQALGNKVLTALVREGLLLDDPQRGQDIHEDHVFLLSADNQARWGPPAGCCRQGYGDEPLVVSAVR